MRTQNQHNMQSTSNGNVTNLTGSTFPKRPNNLTSQSSDHIQMLYSGQQKSTTAVKVKILPLLSEKFEILPLLLLKFTCYNSGQKERLCLIIDQCRRQKLCKWKCHKFNRQYFSKKAKQFDFAIFRPYTNVILRSTKVYDCKITTSSAIFINERPHI
jgi:hypothetical protein